MSSVIFHSDLRSEIDVMMDMLKYAKDSASSAGLKLTNDQLVEIVKASAVHNDTESLSESYCMIADALSDIATVMYNGVSVDSSVGFNEDVFGEVQTGLGSVADSLDYLNPAYEKDHMRDLRKMVVRFRKNGQLIDRGGMLCDEKTVGECLNMGITEDELETIRQKWSDINIYEDEEVSGSQ